MILKIRNGILKFSRADFTLVSCKSNEGRGLINTISYKYILYDKSRLSLF